MKYITGTTIALLCALSGVSAIPTHRHHGNGGGNGAGNAAVTPVPAAGTTADTNTTAAVATTGGTTGGAVTRGPSTEVLFEVNGVPGNECLTFRNNGEIVDAACVNTAADRQITPSTNAAGTAALLVQRTFSAGFRPDLIGAGVQACIGNNGTDFLAQDCATATDLVAFTGGQLVAASGACASGHDGAAQLTIDPTGANCATYTSTTVTPAAV